MNSFTWADLVVVLVKIIVLIGFFVTLAALTTWADRRQSAMVQDRIGPQRAVAWLPSMAVRVLFVVLTALVAGLVIVPMMGNPGGSSTALRLLAQRTTTALELAVLVTWFSLLLLSAMVRRGEAGNGFEAAVARLDPRSYFYIGLGLHVLVIGVAQVVPGTAALVVAKTSVVLAGVIVLASGMYAAIFRVPAGKIGLRLAGILHVAADGLKMIWKEDLRPKNADKLLYALAPLIALFPTLVTLAVVPFGGSVCFKDVANNGALDFTDLFSLGVANHEGICAPVKDAAGHLLYNQVGFNLQISDLNVGLLYVFAIAGTGVIGAAIAGWASDNKFALLGGLRASSQMVSYEVAMGLTIVGLVIVFGTFGMRGMVDWQGQHAWGIFVQPFGFLLFFTALVAETKRVPFDQPEGESEIVAGYFLEYSGMKFGMFYLGEYIEFAFSSALLVTLFFGGYHLPFLHPDGIDISFGGTSLYHVTLEHWAIILLQMLVFFGKTILVTWLQVFVRWSLPRFRYDQLMKLGWTKLLPLALGNIVLTALVVLLIKDAGPDLANVLRWAADVSQALVAVGGIAAVVAFVAWLLEPAKTRRFLGSSTARFAAARGGVKHAKMGA